jgi:hypothetical protein
MNSPAKWRRDGYLLEGLSTMLDCSAQGTKGFCFSLLISSIERAGRTPSRAPNPISDLGRLQLGSDRIPSPLLNFRPEVI